MKPKLLFLFALCIDMQNSKYLRSRTQGVGFYYVRDNMGKSHWETGLSACQRESVMNQNACCMSGSVCRHRPWSLFFFLFFFWTPRQGRWVMPGRSEPGKDYHCVLGQVSGAGGDDGDAAGAVAGDFWGEGSGSEGTETHQPTERQSPTPADSPWGPLWTAACPCSWGGWQEWGYATRPHRPPHPHRASTNHTTSLPQQWQIIY